MRRAFWMPMICGLLVGAGPISRFDTKQPVEAHSNSKLEDIERCLIDLDLMLAPTVYQQPDRPDRVTMIFRNMDNFPLGRIDMQRDGNGTSIRAWMPVDKPNTCYGAS